MASERQRLANQENARKSTGPKSTEGKENSRRNALKHGLAGSGEVLNRSDARKLKKSLIAWRAHLQPIDVLEDCLVRRAALADVRLKRCLKKDLAEVGRRKRRATKRWDVRQQKTVDESVGLLEADPEKAVAQFEAISLGCGWLIDRWKELASALVETGYWDDDQANLAIRMHGQNPATTPMDAASISRLRLAILAVSPELDFDEVDDFFDESTADLDPDVRGQTLSGRLPDPETGRAMLLEIVQDELARLERLKAQLWDEQDAPARQEAEDISLVDTSLAGARALRYETAHEMSVHRSVNLLIRLRKVESEQQTYDRFSKMGVDQGRRFNGTNWEFVRDEAKAQKREEAEKRDYDMIAETVSYKTGFPIADEAVRRSELEKVHEQLRMQAEAKAGIEAGSGGLDGPAGARRHVESPLRNEANFSEATHYAEMAYDAFESRSPDAIGGGTETAKMDGSETRSSATAKKLLDEPAMPPGIRSEANSIEANGYAEVVYVDPVGGSQNQDEALSTRSQCVMAQPEAPRLESGDVR